ncbi:MAG: lysozyme inhibitor LprI family protein [Phreatobacter sp.]|uniref:lysozyme inhibitor LprI family protein n=1 Tax=Phreatobacter sp. TaxID=1966341 RepID=UPI0027362BA8|nr:lysozyme inhibitor LprI family protein [Phreatobacter sp.]MDP2800727.1 lysozyme inhibitor LprI family protein [Phreatobacter sp.]
MRNAATTLLRSVLPVLMLAFVCLSGPALSQQRDEDEGEWVGLAEMLESCIGNARNDAGKRLACVGSFARTCIQRAENQTTMGTERCYMLEHRAWDALLNRYFRERPQGEKGTALVAVQRAWISYRDLKCGYFRIHHDGGSIARILAGNCMMDETGRRAIEVRAFRNQAR